MFQDLSTDLIDELEDRDGPLKLTSLVACLQYAFIVNNDELTRLSNQCLQETLGDSLMSTETFKVSEALEAVKLINITSVSMPVIANVVSFLAAKVHSLDMQEQSTEAMLTILESIFYASEQLFAQDESMALEYLTSDFLASLDAISLELSERVNELQVA